MNLFDKRPLSLILCIFLSGFVIFSTASTALSILILGIGMLLVALFLFSPIKRLVKRALVIASALALLIAFLFSTLYFNLYFNLYKKYEDKGEVEIIATVGKLSEHTSGYTAELIIHALDGEDTEGGAIAYIEKRLCNSLNEYSAVRITAKLSDFENTGDFDTRSYYRARGFSAELTEITSCTVVGNSVGGFDRWLSQRRAAIGDYITDITGEIGGSLLVALLLGERDGLADITRHAFTRLGATHTLAISGMHLVILMYGINRMLLLLRVGKKTRKLAEIILCIAYTALTGFPVSVVRACIMLVLSDLLFLMSSRSDPITSLIISVSLICIVSPYSIYDISLWLSAFATLGLLIYSELFDGRVRKRDGKGYRINRLLSPFVISAFAISSTVLISGLSFDSISVIALIASPIITLITEIYMYLGIVAILLCGTLGTGALTELVGVYITRLVSYFSSFNNIYIAADYAIITFLSVALTVIALLLLVFKIKRKRNILLVLLSLFILINSTASALNAIASSGERTSYVCNGSNELIYLSKEGENAVVDISSVTSTSTYDLIDSVKEMKLRELDKLVYTNYSTTLMGSAERLSSQIYVGSIYLPVPKTVREEGAASEVINYFKDSATSLVFYDVGDFINLSGIVMYPAYRDLVDSKVAFCLIDGDYVTTYLSSGMMDDNTRAVALPLLEGCKTLIFGRHGARYYGERFIHMIPGIEKIILGSRNLTIPQDIIDFYEECEIIYYPEKQELKR